LSAILVVSTFASSSYALTSVEQAYIDHSLHPLIFPAKVIFHQNGSTKELNSSNIILNYNNQSYIPLRAFGECIGAQVDYQDHSTTSNRQPSLDVTLNYDLNKKYDYPQTQDTQSSSTQTQLIQDAPIWDNFTTTIFHVNGKTQIFNDYPNSNQMSMLNYKGRIYIPIRLFSETVGAQVDYSNLNGPTVIVTLDGAKVVYDNQTVKTSNLEITDPDINGFSVGNLVLTKDGDNTKVNGQVEITGHQSTANQIGAGLKFYNENGEEIGFVVISGDYDEGIHPFEAGGKGDFTNYSTVKLNVGYLNGMTQVGPPVKVDQTITLTKNVTMYERAAQESKILGELSPQTVTVFEKFANWYHIHTWKGDAWINIQ
ncbi:MAG TPA: hypothetical protein VJ602_08180, partial [Paludibacter sp.]|nr:hypothetical protein [Paludibacter sp.]